MKDRKRVNVISRTENVQERTRTYRHVMNVIVCLCLAGCASTSGTGSMSGKGGTLGSERQRAVAACNEAGGVLVTDRGESHCLTPRAARDYLRHLGTGVTVAD